MIICGTYRAKRRSCKNCCNFMLWGISYGHCVIYDEDFPAQHVCRRFKKNKPHTYLKEILVNNIIYYIDCYVNNKKTMYIVLANDGSMDLRGVECKHFYTLRDTINAIKKDAFK